MIDLNTSLGQSIFNYINKHPTHGKVNWWIYHEVTHGMWLPLMVAIRQWFEGPKNLLKDHAIVQIPK